MNAFADGLNYFLARHPEVAPRVIRRFEPWMALSFTEGSIGGDIERVDLKKLEAFYGSRRAAEVPPPGGSPGVSAADWVPGSGEADFDEGAGTEPGGSNGIAIAPDNTAGHHALLLINPHTSFFFRSELQVSSREGLDAYGAVTWGQFFVYQGFNERAGWMHTTSGVDAVDEYLEAVHGKDGHFYYRYADRDRRVLERQITVSYRTEHGMAERAFTVYFTHHGPVIREENGKWVTIRLLLEPVKALTEAFTRTKARNYKEFRETMELRANSSNNTVFADADGNIAYFHGNFIPRRDGRFDFTRPVDGSDPATEWRGALAVDDTPHLLNPRSGYLFNVNDAPWTGAGDSSLRKEDYPAYVERGGENPRGLHAIRVLQGRRDFTLDSLMAAAFDSYLPWFEKPLPALIRAWDRLPEGSPMKAGLAGQVGVLRGWDLRWGAQSVATSLAVFWGQEIQASVAGVTRAPGLGAAEYIGTKATDQALLGALSAASARLAADFGSWKTPWGEINRFQRLSGGVVQTFSDAGPSIPVGFTSAAWGSLAAFDAKAYPATKRWYGTGGNSFVAVVEFGERVHARAVTAGGESGHPESPHFNDEAARYSTGNLREVYFYQEQLEGHTEREYHPGGP
jgi:acyl-homoserine lactone acylase PvdQ